MWRGVTVLAIGALAGAPSVVDAQAARVGRLPVLELPPAPIGRCRTDPINVELQRDGIARLISFTSGDSASHRLVSLGMDAKGAPVILMAMMGTAEGRRGETELVNVHFGPTGTILQGSRSAFTTGTPALLRDDRRLALLPADTLRVRRLADALRDRCRV